MKGSILENTLSIIILRAIQSYLNVFLENRKVLKKENGSDKVLALQKQLNTFRQAANADELKAQLYDGFAEGKFSLEHFLIKREKIIAEQKQIEIKVGELEKQIYDMQLALSKVEEKKYDEYLIGETLTRPMVEEFVERIDVYSENFVQVKWKFRNGFEDYEIPTENIE